MERIRLIKRKESKDGHKVVELVKDNPRQLFEVYYYELGECLSSVTCDSLEVAIDEYDYIKIDEED